MKFLFFIIIFLSILTPILTYDFKCNLCKKIAIYGDKLLKNNHTITIIRDILYPYCLYINASGNCYGNRCKEICNDILNEYIPIVSEGLYDSMVDGSLCSSIKFCPPMYQKNITNIPLIYSNLNNYSGERKWDIWDNTSDIGYFIHLTDMHLDPQYNDGLPINCGLPICCRYKNNSNYSGPLSKYWGTPNVSCDIPPRLSEVLHKWFLNNMEPDFFINTGDDPPHNIWNQSKEFNTYVANLVASHHNISFNNIPGFVSIGNHEYFPVDMAKGNNEDDWLYNNMANTWKYWLNDDAVNTLKYGGYYTSRARPKLRIISLNTMLLVPDSIFSKDYAKGNWPDPLAQMAWFNNTLIQSYNRSEKVIVLAHHPFDDWDYRIRDVYTKIISKYNHILLQLHGHSHMNEFFVMYSNDIVKKPIVTGIIGGSLSTTGIAKNNNMGCGFSGNPGFNVYYYNRTSLELLDLEYWWADINYANIHNIEPEWKMQYSAKNIYNMNNLTAKAWELVDKQINNNSTLKSIYYKIWSKGIVY